MEQTIEHLWRIITWGLGSCLTGFLFLAGWVLMINSKMSEKVSYKWFEEKMEKEIKKDIGQVVGVLNEIKDALIGNFEKKGIITRTAEAEKRIEHIENDIHSIKQKIVT